MSREFGLLRRVAGIAPYVWAALGLATVFALLVGVLLTLDVMSTGPYTRWFNESHFATGQPTPDSKWVVTYNYAPCPWMPFRKFQVHLQDGVVTGLEQFDD